MFNTLFVHFRKCFTVSLKGLFCREKERKKKMAARAVAVKLIPLLLRPGYLFSDFFSHHSQQTV
jgi:hypothetical protein